MIKRTIELGRLSMKECGFQQKEQSSLKSIYGSEPMEFDIGPNPAPDKRKNIMNGKKVGK